MTDIARPERQDEEAGASRATASCRTRPRGSTVEVALAGEPEEDLFGDPFERPRESAR